MDAKAPNWMTDYAAARQQSEKEKKPMVVVLSSGKKGWQKLSRDGKLGNVAMRFLADKYICLYVNTATADGRELAADFEMSGLGIVISDQSGRRQAFRHEGDLEGSAIDRYLERYSDPDRVLQFTETNPAEFGQVNAGPSFQGFFPACAT
jgi:hypothetical protein